MSRAAPRRRLLAAALLLALAATPWPGAPWSGAAWSGTAGAGAAWAAAPDAPAAQSRYFVTSDGVRLHYLEAGPPTAHTLIFVPGWAMPAWIWAAQIQAFAHGYHVVAFDPRGQGQSDIPPTGYEPNRRGQDIAELIARVSPAPAVVVGWSLGVLDTLAYVHTHGDARIAGLVLVDNSVGEEPAPPPRKPSKQKPPPHAVFMARFVRSMFHTPQSPDYLQRLTEDAMRLPQADAAKLLNYPVPRTYWREAVYATGKPVLYVVRPWLSGQAGNLARNHPDAETAIFADAGHALFVDDAQRFDSLLDGFLRRQVWPAR
ncbi:MAG: alpha/beta hydrolase [Proteobacteria bacterium]|nr:alpha/beta hydrolase [Pseudomonadota bacterium]